MITAARAGLLTWQRCALLCGPMMLAMVVGHSLVLMVCASLAAWWESWHPRAWRDRVPVTLIAAGGAVAGGRRTVRRRARPWLTSSPRSTSSSRTARSPWPRPACRVALRARRRRSSTCPATSTTVSSTDRRVAGSRSSTSTPRPGDPRRLRPRSHRSSPNPRSGRYVADGDATSAASIAINAFGTVFQTVRMFEGPDALGRQVDWAFGSEQLLVVPRAGEWANAFYERATRSLQFFSFAGQDGGAGLHGTEPRRRRARVRARTARRGRPVALRQLDPAVGRHPRGRRRPGRRDHGPRQPAPP